MTILDDLAALHPDSLDVVLDAVATGTSAGDVTRVYGTATTSQIAANFLVSYPEAYEVVPVIPREDIDAARDLRQRHNDAVDMVEAVPVLTTLSTVKPERVSWLWPGRLPLGKLVLLDGDPSVGKSTLALDVAARVSTGRDWPDGAPGMAGDVVLLSAEDGLADTIAPRLEAAGAARQRVHALTAVTHADDEGKRYDLPPSLPRDLGALEKAVIRHGARLVVVDVLMAYLSGKVDSHRDQDVRGVLHHLAAMAERTGCVVILIRHLRKSHAGNAMYAGGGSIGIIGAARAAYVVARDPDDEERRIIAPIKSNLAIEPPALAYRLESHPELEVARVAWEDAPVTLKAADLLRSSDQDSEASDRRGVDAWLEGLLSDGAVKVNEIYRGADAAGYSKDQAKRAKKRLGVEAIHPDIKGPWFWTLPNPDDQGSTQGSKGAGARMPAPLAPLEPSSAPLWSDADARRCPEGVEGASTNDQTSSTPSPDTIPQDPPDDDPDLDPTSIPDDLPATCRECGQPLLLRQPGRDVCARCRTTAGVVA